MTVNNSIRVIIALQDSVAVVGRWRDDGMAGGNEKFRSADQGAGADLTGVVIREN